MGNLGIPDNKKLYFKYPSINTSKELPNNVILTLTHFCNGKSWILNVSLFDKDSDGELVAPYFNLWPSVEILNTLGKNNLDGLISKLKELDPEQLWTVKITPYKSTRSLDQNEYYWRLVTELANYFGLKSKDEMHEVLLYKLLSKEKQIKNLKVMTVGSTTKLNVKEFNEYLEKVKDFARGYGFKLNEEEVQN